MPDPHRILIGGVPFGRNNVGDEAILECVVGLLRRLLPEARLTASTDDPGTARRLGIGTVELFGFQPPWTETRLRETLRAHDLFLWAGATGLSDYPEIPARFVRIAAECGVPSAIWAVGMNSELNPAHYRLAPGKRRALLSAASRLTAGLWNAVEWEERRREARARRSVAQAAAASRLVVVRDPESAAELRRSGFQGSVTVGADTALLLEPSPWDAVRIDRDARAIIDSSCRKIGICVSAQRTIARRPALVAMLDRLLEDPSHRIVFVPMNPLTDAALMDALRRDLRRPERACVTSGRLDPAEVLAIASRLDVIASSRLHLLIFASIAHVPVIGISRGSKVDNFLAPFGLKPAGSVEQCDFAALEAEIRRLLSERAAFEVVSRRVRAELLGRLDRAAAELAALLEAL